jgi:hypothetical protein
LRGVLTEAEAATLTRRLDALDTIEGCRGPILRLMADQAAIEGIDRSVRYCVRLAMDEDRAGVWRRRGAGSWSHVLAVVAGLGVTPRLCGSEDSVCADQVRNAVAESLCDAAIADLSECVCVEAGRP